MAIPNNIADAASAIKDGTLGPIEVIKIGDLIVSALTGLSAPSELIPTRRSVEDGYEVVNRAVELPQALTLNIVLANPDFSVEAGLDAAMSGSFAGFLDTWRDKIKYLKQLQTDKEIVPVQTHEGVYETMLVTLIDPLYDVVNNADAWIGTVYLDEIRINPAGAGGLIDAAKQAVGNL